MTVWQVYRKRFWFTQLFALLVCAMLWYFQNSPWPVIAATFVIMQVANVAGAWWGFRLSERIKDEEGGLPLDKG